MVKKILLGILLVLIVSFFFIGSFHKTTALTETEKETVDPLKQIDKEPSSFQFPGVKGDIGKVFYFRVVMSWFVIMLLCSFGYFATRRFSEVPSRLQGVAEVVLNFFDEITKDTLGRRARKYFPLICSLFLFILLSNWLGLIPKIFEFFGLTIAFITSIFDKSIEIKGKFLQWVLFVPKGHWLGIFGKIPEFESSTADLNTTLGCGIIVLCTVHYAAIRTKGFWKYIKGYAQPIIFFFPINVVTELVKGVSLSFRLFGNILGGSIVILVLSTLLLKNWLFLPLGIVIPIGLTFFLVLFIGLIQAFVFSMLAMTYLAVLIGEE